MPEIKSPLSDSMILEREIKAFFNAKKLDMAFVYIQKGDLAKEMSTGMCPHALIELGTDIIESANNELKKDHDSE